MHWLPLLYYSMSLRGALFRFWGKLSCAGDRFRENPFSFEFQGEYGLRREGKSPVGNVRKCTFCLHLQDEKGNYTRPPACAETCMAKAIHFGDLGSEADGHCIAHAGFLAAAKSCALSGQSLNKEICANVTKA